MTGTLKLSSDVSSVTLADRLAEVKRRVHQASHRAGLDPDIVTLVAVSKNVPSALVAEVVRLGLTHLGENRVQEALVKIPQVAGMLPGDLSPVWRFLGHLQTNKAFRAIELFDVIQSLDSLKLARVLDRAGASRSLPVRCLVEVKVSTEEAKSGISPGELPNFLESLRPLTHLQVEGLMALAPQGDSPETARPFFRQARTLFQANRAYFSTPDPVLSMGMSGDFEVAVEEGATQIRIGAALFGPRPL